MGRQEDLFLGPSAGTLRWGSTKHAKSTKDPGKGWDSPRHNPLTGPFEIRKPVEILFGSLGFASFRVLRGHLFGILPPQRPGALLVEPEAGATRPLKSMEPDFWARIPPPAAWYSVLRTS